MATLVASERSLRMSTIVLQEQLRIPSSVVDVDSFRRWARSDEFPDRGRYSFLGSELWVDIMPEQLFTNNDVKMEFAAVLRGLLKTTRRGRFFGDGALVTNVPAELSTEPDGTIVLLESLRAGAVQLVEAADEGFVEIAGTPDLVLEVVSARSERKDTVVLRELYWQAGIAEYWLVDARGDQLRFDILKHVRRGYAPTRHKSGWVRSSVLDRSFRLICDADAAGNPEYRLEARS
jgi:Uma2 family endonuclease